MRPSQRGLRVNWRGIEDNLTGLGASWRGLRASWRELRASWRGLKASCRGLRASRGGTKKQTDGRKISPFYMTTGALPKKRRCVEPSINGVTGSDSHRNNLDLVKINSKGVNRSENLLENSA